MYSKVDPTELYARVDPAKKRKRDSGASSTSPDSPSDSQNISSPVAFSPEPLSPTRALIQRFNEGQKRGLMKEEEDEVVYEEVGPRRPPVPLPRTRGGSGGGATSPDMWQQVKSVDLGKMRETLLWLGFDPWLPVQEIWLELFYPVSVNKGFINFLLWKSKLWNCQIKIGTSGPISKVKGQSIL